MVDNNIRKINNTTLKKISAGFQIKNLANTIKELIENSLDAQSNKISIKIQKTANSLKITVKDNGNGISPENLKKICKKNSTSKIKNFGDLSILNTFGFRGEALHCICSMAFVSIISYYKNEKLISKFDKFGKIIQFNIKENKKAITGAKIILTDFMKCFPVRHEKLIKNFKNEIKNLKIIVNRFLLKKESPNIELILIKNNKKSKLIPFYGICGQAERIVKILGPGVLPKMRRIFLKNNLNYQSDDFFEVNGFLAIDDLDKIYEYLYVNNMFIFNKEIKNIINNVVKTFHDCKKVSFILEIKINAKNVDFNISADKTKILFQNDNFFQFLRTALKKHEIEIISKEKNLICNIENNDSNNSQNFDNIADL